MLFYLHAGDLDSKAILLFLFIFVFIMLCIFLVPLLYLRQIIKSRKEQNSEENNKDSPATYY